MNKFFNQDAHDKFHASDEDSTDGNNSALNAGLVCADDKSGVFVREMPKNVNADNVGWQVDYNTLDEIQSMQLEMSGDCSECLEIENIILLLNKLGYLKIAN